MTGETTGRNEPILRRVVEGFAADIETARSEGAPVKNVHRIVETLGSKPFAVTGMKSVVVPLDGQSFNAQVASDIVTGRAPVIYADEVADYLGSEVACIDALAETPRPMPPFDQCWVEGCPWQEDDLMTPAYIAARAQYVSIGGFVKLVKLYDREHAATRKAVELAMANSGDAIVNEDRQPFVAVEVYVYTNGVNGETFGPIFRMIYFLNAAYELLMRRRTERDQYEHRDTLPIVFTAPLCLPPLLKGIANAAKVAAGVEEDAFIESFTISTAKLATAMVGRVFGLLNCSNVEMVPEGKVPDLHPPRRAQRAGLAWIKYHVLKVRVGKELKPIQPRKRDVTGRGVALHLVRGHFKSYESGPGLFGRLKGSKYAAVWCPPYLRGAAEAGAVVKDYRLQPAAPEVDRDEPASGTV